MVEVLSERRMSLEGLSFVLLTSAYAEALAVEAPPSIESAAAASHFVRQCRSDGTLRLHGTVAVAFGGCAKPGRLVVDELRRACVYIVTANLTESALDNATSFLADVEARMPEVTRIVASAGFQPRSASQ